MRRNGTRLQLILSLAGLVLFAGPRGSVAQDEADSGFKLHVDPIVFGAFFRDVDTPSSKFEEYRDMDQGAVMPRFTLMGESKDGNTTFDLFARNVRREDARYTLKWNRSGSMAAMFDYNLIPHRFGNDGRMIYTRTDDGVYAIANPSQAANQAALEKQFATNPSGINFNFLDRLLQPYVDTAQRVDPRLERERMRGRLDFGKMSTLAGGVQVDHEHRDGTRPYGASFGFGNATEIPEPIDYDTTSADLFGEWKGEHAGARFGYVYSHFQNDNKSVLYDNPFRATDSTDPSAYSAPASSTINGPATGRNALAPDNTANTVYVTGDGKFGHSAWYNARFSYGAMKQDDALLPYSTNTAIKQSTGAPFDVTDANNLPQGNADESAKTTNLTGNVGFRFGHGSIKGRYRLYDYNNDSAVIEFPGYVRFDAVWEAIGRVTVPSEYRRQTFGVTLAWDFAGRTHLEGDFSRENYDRTLREIDNADDNVFKVSLDTHALDPLLIRGSYEHGDRSIGTYDTNASENSFTEGETSTNLPDLRKFDEAARKYNAENLFLQISPHDKLDISFGVTGRKDDYDESLFGLVTDRIWRISGDVDYALRDDLTLYGFGHRADRKSFQRARQSGSTPSTNPADNWDLRLKEITDTWGAGITAKFAHRWSADFSGQYNKADGTSDFFSPPGGTPDAAVGFPEYDDNKFWNLAGKVLYNVNRHITASAAYSHELYNADRFARDGLDFYNPNALILNANDGDYEADIFAADLHIHF